LIFDPLGDVVSSKLKPTLSQDSSRKARTDLRPAPLGSCPLCGSVVVDQGKSYGCSEWRSGCRFAIWKRISGKFIGTRSARALLRDGRTSVLKGFESKAGKRFEARLKLNRGVVTFDFGN
jgi:DNA topoisomerase-3